MIRDVNRYHRQLHHPEDYFSEFALMKYRVWVEIEYFLFRVMHQEGYSGPCGFTGLWRTERRFACVINN